jgi:hypothetical protein
MQTSQIAESLLKGGITTKGANFNANVSAVLSNMVREQIEVRSGDDGYERTSKGREAWLHIKDSAQMRARTTTIGL